MPITWRPYDVVELEPIRVKLPARPFVGALILTLRDPENHRFAANYVNLVVKPEHPLPRVQRQGPARRRRPVRAGGLRPPEMVRAGQAAGGQGLRLRQGLLRVPPPDPRRGRQGPSGVDLLPVRGLGEGEPRARGLARARQPPGLSPDRRRPPVDLDPGGDVQRSPDRDASPCPTIRPTAAASSRTSRASSTGATASWSTARSRSNDERSGPDGGRRADGPAVCPSPTTLRTAGGLCIFGADHGRAAPRSDLGHPHPRPAPGDLGAGPDAGVARPAGP